MNTITNFDFSILNWIHEHITCSFLDFIMPKITLLGNGGAIWIASAVIMLFFRKSRKTGIMLGSGLCSGVLIGNILLKNLVARGRPCWINKSIQLLISIPQDYSFPSGHTMSSFIAATIIMHFNKKLGAAAFVLAAMIAFSRLYLYVHFPTDVMAGALIGVAIGCIICKISDTLSARRSSAKTNQKLSA